MTERTSVVAAALAAVLYLGGCQTTEDWAGQKCQQLGKGGAELQSCVAEQRAWLDYNHAVQRAGRR